MCAKTITLPVETVHDARLSPEARTALAIGLCYPTGQLPTPVHPFFRRQGIARRSIERVLRELEDAGYLARARVATARGKHGGSRYRYEFRQRPVDKSGCNIDRHHPAESCESP